MGLNALLAPYNYYMGGHFHWLPGWQGLARFHTVTSGGDYVLWLRFNPTTPGYLKSSLNGNAYLCTPRGERFTLHMGGSMPRNTGRDLAGVPLHLYMFRYTTGAQLSGDTRPKIDLWGSFGDRVLTVDDHATVAHAFNADATLNDGHWEASRDEAVHFVLHEGSPWTIRPSCAEMFKSAPSGDWPRPEHPTTSLPSARKGRPRGHIGRVRSHGMEVTWGAHVGDQRGMEGRGGARHGDGGRFRHATTRAGSLRTPICGSMRATTWIPREPDVFGQPTRPWSVALGCGS